MIFVFLAILFFLAVSWKNQEGYLFANKSPFEGPDEHALKNVVLNALNRLLVLFMRHKTPILPIYELYPQINILRERWKDIRDEAIAVMGDAPAYHEVDVMNAGLSTHDNKYWNTFILKYYQDFNELNSKRCPITTKLLKQMPEVNLAMFSILERGKKLYPHHGPWGGVMRIHLGLKIPESKPFISVGKETYYWKEGEVFAFNDTYLHSVENPEKDGGDRIILFLDVHRPDVPSYFHYVTNLASAYFREVNQKSESLAAKKLD